MVDGKVVGDATITEDTIAYAFAGTYAQGSVIQANLLFKYNAGQTVTSGINYVVTYETPFNVTVPDGSEACYLVFAEEGLEKAVEMDWVSLNTFKTVVPFNAMGKEYYYSLKTEENFYEVDAEGTAVMRTYKGEADVVVAWNQLCAPYYELVVNDSVVVELKFEGELKTSEVDGKTVIPVRYVENEVERPVFLTKVNISDSKNYNALGGIGHVGTGIESRNFATS